MSHRTWSQSYRRLLNREPPGPPPEPVRTLVTQGIIIVRTIAPDITPDIAETMPRALPVRDGLFGELGLPSAKESLVKHKLECARQSAGVIEPRACITCDITVGSPELSSVTNDTAPQPTPRESGLTQNDRTVTICTRAAFNSETRRKIHTELC